MVMAQHTSIYLREEIFRLWQQEKISRTVASIVYVGKSTVNDFVTKYRLGYGLQHKHRSGRPRKTTL